MVIRNQELNTEEEGKWLSVTVILSPYSIMQESFHDEFSPASASPSEILVLDPFSMGSLSSSLPLPFFLVTSFLTALHNQRKDHGHLSLPAAAYE